MAYLIDGHNLIGTGQLKGIRLQNENDELALVRLLRVFRSRTKESVTVFFDAGILAGRSRALSGSGVDVIFAAQSSNADTLIYNRVKRTGEGKRLTVVTSDRQLAERCRAEGAQILSSPDFLARLQRLPERRSGRSKPAPTNEDEKKPVVGTVDEWLEIFGPYRPRRKK